jgi:hypothetical protein
MPMKNDGNINLDEDEIKTCKHIIQRGLLMGKPCGVIFTGRVLDYNGYCWKHRASTTHVLLQCLSVKRSGERCTNLTSSAIQRCQQHHAMNTNKYRSKAS